MALYKRRRTKDRPVSVFTGGSSPVLLSARSHSTSPGPGLQSPPATTDLVVITEFTDVTDTTLNSTLTSDESGCGLDSTLTSCTTQSDCEEYDLEVSTCVCV